MGRIIQQNNGKTTIYVTGEDFNNLSGTTDTYYVGVDLNSGLFEKKNPNGSLEEFGGGSTFTGGTVTGTTTFTDGLSANTFSATTLFGDGSNLTGIVTKNYSSVTYSELSNLISGNSLDPGSYYLINDFQTCYDQPDFDYNGNPITTGNYKQGPVEPILVLATSANTISEIAYQPSYPKDRILYDWTWNQTEVTSGVTFGRISERIDEFNNRTDYDHRNILFKRYRLFNYIYGLPLNGTIELLSDGTINGTDTSFTALTVGDVVYIPSTYPSYYEIVSITGNTAMTVSGDTISAVGAGQQIYPTVEETNGSGYFSYKRTNVKTNDFIEYTTFGDAIFNDYAKNNYIGNFANNYQNISSGIFILANNVFLEGQYESNKFGDYCFNNTFGTDNTHNIWGDWCYENVSTNDIDDNIIGHYFNRNLINANLTSNHIGNDFNNNRLLNGNGTDFEDNIIGNGFNNNLIYHGFYKNEILDNFNNNVIGDFGNLDNFEFYRNYIRNNFNNNTIRQNFQNNQIGTNFQNNEINGESQGNTILNGFVSNVIGSYFSVNNIGNAFNNNIVNDSFYQNTTDYQFNDNYVGNEFYINTIGAYFVNNGPSNLNLFGWSDLSTVSTRTYSTFNNSLDGVFGKILGKELVMEVTSTSQYFKIKFTQWSTNDNGFQYTREEIDSAGNSLGPVITFTLANGGTDVDYIVPGVVEITRSGTQPIYNSFAEPGWDNSVSPSGTSWNSIYTQSNNGERFAYNKIGNNFTDNTIGGDFGYGLGDPYGNIINDNFQNNTIGQFAYNNVIGNQFRNNTVGDNFENNSIQSGFQGNSIDDSFDSNRIGNSFINNTIGLNFQNNTIADNFGNDGSGSPGLPNQIFDDFKSNVIGNNFGNYLNVDGGNLINTGFSGNVIGDNFFFNVTDTNTTNNKIGNDFIFNLLSPNFVDNNISNVCVGNTISSDFVSNKIGNYMAFNTINNTFENNDIGDYFGNGGSGTENVIDGTFTNNKIGNYFGNDSTNNAGGNVINFNFYDNLIGNKFYNNTTDAEFFRNDIGNEFFSNTLNGGSGNIFHNNEIGNRFNSNTTFGYFYGNVIGGGFNNNDIADQFYSNEIGYGFNNNSISGSFYVNVVLYYFNNNTCGSDTSYNKFGDYFASNTFSNNFQKNNITNNIQSTDFTSATYVYDTSMDKNIFNIQGGSAKLSYYDSSSVLNIVNITD
jgi:hypothetical protein